MSLSFFVSLKQILGFHRRDDNFQNLTKLSTFDKIFLNDFWFCLYVFVSLKPNPEDFKHDFDSHNWVPLNRPKIKIKRTV